MPGSAGGTTAFVQILSGGARAAGTKAGALPVQAASPAGFGKQRLLSRGGGRACCALSACISWQALVLLDAQTSWEDLQSPRFPANVLPRPRRGAVGMRCGSLGERRCALETLDKAGGQVN